MLTAPERARFRKRLLAWFAEFQRDLPWRRTKDPYRIWLSEIMLQQTRVVAAIPYYERFLERFPNVESLAEADEQEVLRHWAGLGYYSRARNLQKAARQIVVEYGSQFPKDPDKALALSGIGSYTAAAVLSIAYEKKMAVLDGNVARVLARLDATRGDLRTGSQWQQLQKRADELLAPAAPGDWNQAMMELGAIICTPRSPQCLLCPVAEFCEARKLALTDVIPEKRLQRTPVELILAALVLVDPAGHTLLLPPPKRDVKAAGKHDVATLLSRMWHFPTIHVEQDTRARASHFREGHDFLRSENYIEAPSFSESSPRGNLPANHGASLSNGCCRIAAAVGEQETKAHRTGHRANLESDAKSCGSGAFGQRNYHENAESAHRFALLLTGPFVR